MGVITAIFAHPDDESFGPGGTMAKLAKENDLYLICCTDGNHQDKNLKSTRERELDSAAQILGIKKVFQLSFQDGYLCNANYHTLASEIREVLDNLQPETILTFHPNGVSGHLDHIAVTSVVNYLFAKLSYINEVWYYTKLVGDKKPDYFVYWPEGQPREQMNKIINISEVLSTKEQAIRAHVSQLPEGETEIKKLFSSIEEFFVVRSKE